MLGRLRSWLRELRQPEDDPAPDEPVEVALVAHMNGPLAADLLEREGIRVVAVPGWNMVSQTSSHTRIMVLGADEETARRLLDEAGLTESSSVRRRHR